uniref:Uncharacterized protein n=1 Tax=Anguilla anguilla TaxID=7936 RepID=A0A0E9Q2L0_ANGAN
MFSPDTHASCKGLLCIFFTCLPL